MSRDRSRVSWEGSGGDSAAIRHLKRSIAHGKPWYIALLEAIGLWVCPEENHNGHHYCYLIDGEAFDWLLLAERLCQEVADAIPEEELAALLFSGRLPEDVSQEEFRNFIGDAKYHAYLNYLYGVTIEECVLLAVEEEIRKERQAHVFSVDEGEFADSYHRLYGANQETLLQLFRREKKYPQSKTISLEQAQEFTYWLFKYRLKNCDKARVASDTKKGVEHLKRQNLARGISVGRKKTPYLMDHIS